MKIKFLGAAHEVTGSCTLVNVGGVNLLIDCGMEQGADIYENCELPISANEVDYVFLTHAHIDHSGMLPALVARGYKGNIYSTAATHMLCKIMLMDSAHIQEQEAEWRNRKAKRSGQSDYVPAYTTKDAAKTLSRFIPCNYSEYYEIGNNIRVRFMDAGHLLGSSSIELTVTEEGVKKVLLFSGDVGNVDRPLIRDPQKPDYADVVVIESTYGDRLHGERKDYLSQFVTIIQDSFDRGGNLIIPSFAVGRTQEMLYMLREIKERALIKGHDGFPVYVDSPLAVDATRIYAGDSGDMLAYYDKSTLALINRGVNVLKFDDLYTSETKDESIALNQNPEPKIIISASGMCEAGRIRHHLKHNLWRADSTVLFVGYQAVGTLGRAIVEGAKTVNLFGEEVAVNAKIEIMDGISGHADRDMLLGWLKALKNRPDVIYVNHGDDEVCDSFAKLIIKELDFKAVAPYNGGEYDLISGKCLEVGNMKYIDKTERQSAKGQSAVYAQLQSALDRLNNAVRHNEGGANSDLRKFAAELDALCKRWDR